MRPVWHTIAGIGIGTIAYRTTANWQLAAILTITEIFIDLDHAIEHVFRSEYPFCLRTFLSERNSLDWPRMVFILHSYEWIIFLTVLAWYFSLPFFWALVIGATVHIFLDEIGNRLYIWPGHMSLGFYFFSYRLYRGFRTERLIYEDRHKRLQKETGC